MGLRWDLIDFESLVMEVRKGYARSQVTKIEIGVFPRRTTAGPGRRNHSARMERLCPETQGDWVFPSLRTNKPYDSGSLRKKVLNTVALRAKIQGQIGWHTLRHSYRAWLDETGAPLGYNKNSCVTPTSQPR